jgi:hypothetical protein
MEKPGGDWTQRNPFAGPRVILPTTETDPNGCRAARKMPASGAPSIRLPWIKTPSAGAIVDPNKMSKNEDAAQTFIRFPTSRVQSGRCGSQGMSTKTQV